MRPIDNVEKSIKKLRYKASAGAHSRVLDNILLALENRQQPAVTQPNIWRIIMKSPITKVAAVTVVIVAIGFLIFHTGPDKQDSAVKVSGATQSPAELTTFASLSFAYRRGGMEAVEEMCDKAFEMAGPRLAKISIGELLEESNGS
ncbi:MAG: hypothetical protein JSW23_09040 [Planctomycetota bacterium]|nr:MAG: hypothetical protein JSW23_09040 [Planctomycetota bacterium]